ncbi:hypothetical protein DAPPUDRAFT_317144 [Daphnia pulex]|uniref:Uncharacterized protein n=1 Tax=Daphnia pulex TaxID=6669 RepID=E9GF21_DAPPU|nr:hypothetical protein DAPPUDRAFT_317144 [Daphnia pulex]|eukprot:EFX81977.1 hypothetical protein DAPPUDRAFT_317144 [Daphnia pulex]
MVAIVPRWFFVPQILMLEDLETMLSTTSRFPKLSNILHLCNVLEGTFSNTEPRFSHLLHHLHPVVQTCGGNVNNMYTTLR